jgi:hypothetical protein
MRHLCIFPGAFNLWSHFLKLPTEIQGLGRLQSGFKRQGSVPAPELAAPSPHSGRAPQPGTLNPGRGPRTLRARRPGRRPGLAEPRPLRRAGGNKGCGRGSGAPPGRARRPRPRWIPPTPVPRSPASTSHRGPRALPGGTGPRTPQPLGGRPARDAGTGSPLIVNIQ